MYKHFRNAVWFFLCGLGSFKVCWAISHLCLHDVYKQPISREILLKELGIIKTFREILCITAGIA